jgi:hypothetical protein
MSEEEPFEFIDQFGEVRRCGSWKVPENFVSSFNTFEGEFPLWTDAQIMQALRDPGRRVTRKVLGPEWIPNQGPYSSCNGFAAANAYSRARYFGGKRDGKIFSGSYVYAWVNGGRDAGSALEDSLKEQGIHGNVLLSKCGPSMIYRSQTAQFDAEAAQEKAVNAYAVQTMQGLKTAGAAGFMLIVAIQVGRTWERLDSRGVSGVDSGGGNHAVCCDDYLLLPDGTPVFDCVMDWGISHGVKGKTYLTEAHFAQTIGRHQFYAIPTGQAGSGA